MIVPAAPAFAAGITTIAALVVVLLRSVFAFERELFVVRIEDVRRAMTDAHDRGELQDSPRFRYLLNVASSSVANVETITPLRIAAVTRSFGVVRQVQAAPKADRHALERYHRQMTGAWARLLILGSPSGWTWTIVNAPGIFVQAIRRHRKPRRAVQEQVTERLVAPADPMRLRPPTRSRQGDLQPV